MPAHTRRWEKFDDACLRLDQGISLIRL